MTAGESSIAIVGVGVRCPVGLAASPAAAAVRAGISGLREHPWMLDKAGYAIVAAYDTLIDPELESADRFALLAQWALEEALQPLSHLERHGSPPVDVLIGLPESRPGLPVEIETRLRNLLSATAADRVGQIAFLPQGNAAGLLAMQAAAQALHQGRSRLCLAGGVDSHLSVATLEWMDEMEILKSSVNRNGYPPGEAAGFCLLTRGDIARELRLPVLAWLESSGWAREASSIRTQTICVGRGLSQAIEAAIGPIRSAGRLIDDVICDLNGEPYRSEEFAFTVLRTQTAFVDATRFVTPADCWGDVGAASGPLFANLAVSAIRRGHAKGPRALLWASSIGGDRAAIVVRSPIDAP